MNANALNTHTDRLLGYMEAVDGHVASAHCPCGPTAEVVWGKDDLRIRLLDVIEHVGAEAEDEAATPEMLLHALNEAGLAVSIVREHAESCASLWADPENVWECDCGLNRGRAR